MDKTRTYYCIDMKTFYASVECAERGLNPFETNLVVADVTRGQNALCLAITPKMKAQGIKNRCRLSDIPCGVRYEVAPPRMALYIEYAADIYSLYLDYFAPQDIHVYSIDESFIDATDYLGGHGRDKIGFAKFLMNEIADRYHIPSTAGVGTNLYLAKIALDITAKHARDHVGYLDEERYRQTLWDHRPITDFWMVAAGTARRLERYGVSDAYIQDIVVRTDYRGQGWGRKIVAFLVKELRAAGVDWIGLVGAPGTKEFYEKMGFAPMPDFVPMKYQC